MMRWRLNLDITTRTERYILALRQLHHELFNEGRYVVVRLHRTVPLTNTKYFFWQFDLHVLLHIYLARQATAFTSFTFSDVIKFRRQNITATLFDHNPALPARTTATTG